MRTVDRVPLKHVAGVNLIKLDENTDPETEFRYVDIGSVGRGFMTDEPETMRFADAPSRARRLVRPGDTIVSTVRTYLRAVLPIGDEADELVVSTGFAVVTPRKVEARFLSWYLQSDPFVDEVVARSVGVSYPAINPSEIGEMDVPMPGLAEQRAIADYLDTETTRIDALITKKRRMIEVLDERLSRIREAAFATRPEWPLKRLLSQRMAYGVLVPRFVDPGDGVPMLRITNLDKRGGVILDDVAWIADDLAREYKRTFVREGELVISVVGSMGRSAVIPPAADGWNLNRALARIQPESGVVSRLLWHWTQTQRFIDQARLATGSGTAQPTLNLGDLAEFGVGLPADKARWPTLLLDLDSSSSQIQSVQDSIAQQIDLLVEHRQALITAAVTGELPVPGVAA